MDRRTREEQADPDAVDLKVDTSPGVTLRPRRARRRSNLGGAVNWNLVGVSGALLLLAGLHFSERIRVPGLEHWTYARMFAAPEPVRVARATPAEAAQPAPSSKPKPQSEPVRPRRPNQHASNTPSRPAQAPISTPQPTVADPVAFLGEQGIVKKDGKFVLESESNIDACLNGIGEQAKRFTAACQDLETAQTNVVTLRDVQATLINIDQQIAIYDGEMGKFPVVWRRGALWAGITAEDNARYYQMKTERDRLVAQRNQQLDPFRRRLQLGEPGRALDRATHEFRTRADEAGRHLQGGREVVERISSECERLAAAPEVRAALRKVGQDRLELSPGYREKSNRFWTFQKTYENSVAMAGGN